ncbi:MULTISPECIES: hypothetical protein [unclassified Lysinibacillus]|uniref:hypothetical protein n=1 Tax=unclassified Lysinibacillus TaxID=2636778 RepID=UPI00382430D3
MDITKKRKTTIGLLVHIISALFTAMSQVVYAKQVQEVPAFLFTGISLFLTAFYFAFFARTHKQHNKWQGTIGYVVKLNGASVLAFMCFYFALNMWSLP